MTPQRYRHYRDLATRAWNAAGTAPTKHQREQYQKLAQQYDAQAEAMAKAIAAQSPAMKYAA